MTIHTYILSMKGRKLVLPCEWSVCSKCIECESNNTVNILML